MRVNVICGTGLALLMAGNSAAAADDDLVRAVKQRDKTEVRALLQKRVDINDAEADGTTPLHWAVRNNDLEMVTLLTRAGANVKVANRYGVTPILQACETADAAVVDVLLGAGADANSTRPEGETALMVAARTGKVGCRQSVGGSRCQRQRQRELARPDRVDVGGRRGSW